MLVYQALKRLVGAAQVATVLDDDGYQQELREQDSNDSASTESQSDDGGAVASHTSDAFLGHALRTPIVWEEYSLTGPLDPECISRRVQSSGSPTSREETCYPRKRVTWLNVNPHSEEPKELAVAFLTVS